MGKEVVLSRRPKDEILLKWPKVICTVRILM